jgi:hypothetical protein
MSEDGWSHTKRIVNVVIAVHIQQMRALCTSEAQWHRLSRQAHVAVNAPRDGPHGLIMMEAGRVETNGLHSGKPMQQTGGMVIDSNGAVPQQRSAQTHIFRAPYL